MTKLTKRGWEQLRNLAAEKLGCQDFSSMVNAVEERPSGHFESIDGKIAWSPKAAMQLPFANAEWHRLICLALSAKQDDPLVVIEVI